MRCCWLSIFLWALVCPQLSAQEGAPENVIRLKVRPAAAPVPALKYQLLPDARKLQPGNAAVSYLRAATMDYAQHRQPQMRQAISEWLQAKTEGKTPPLPTQFQFLKDNYWPLQQIDIAARQEYCHWQLTDRLRKEGLQVVLPEIQQLRDWANLLNLRFRLELQHGDLPKALYTCQTGLAMGRHTADAPTLMSAFIAHGISNAMLDNVQEILTSSRSPNLYWALTELPRPWIDLRRTMLGESLWIEALLADFPDIHEVPLPPAGLAVLRQRLKILGRLLSQRHSLGADEAITILVLKGYPTARAWLLAQGKPADLVERMPSLQVVLLYSLDEYQRMTDGILKLQSLPYREARPFLTQWQQEMRQTAMHSKTIPFTAQIGSYEYALGARARVERKIDLLRTIEALRMYAAAHGQWPATLEEIKEVPLPLDCYTGKPFSYRREGDKAYLLAAPPKPQMYVDEKASYELTLVK